MEDPNWLDGKRYVGVWHASQEDAAARQAALDRVPQGRYRATVVSPLSTGRLDPPDISLIYATPGSSMRIEVENVDAFCDELRSRNYANARPQVEDTLWNTRDFTVSDPFGNRLTFTSAIST